MENIKRKAIEVVEFLRSQKQQIGRVKLLGLKVLLPDEIDTDEVCTYITKNYMEYDAHIKSEYEAILSIWYKNLVPCVSRKECYIEELAEEVIELFQKQKRNSYDLQLLSIKVILPREADSNKISTYIVERYPEYKAHLKKQGAYPIVAIGHR